MLQFGWVLSQNLLESVCFTDVSLSAAATEWKERSSEEKVARLLAEGAVVVNSLRRYLKLSSLPPAVSWPFCILSWTAALCSGARLQGPRWIMAHFFQLWEREERLPSQLIWLLAILTTTTSRPDEGFIRLYIDTHTHTQRSSHLSRGLRVVPPSPPAPASHPRLCRFMVEGKACPAVE